mgnify:CR=1 FL=1|jgi:hypothetical protein
MINNLLIGFFNLSVTVIVHSMAMLIATHFFRKWMQFTSVAPMAMEVLRVTFLVVLLTTATLLEALWWAASYFYLGVIQSLEAAIYFSIVTYTTLGYGDITLNEQWRMLSAFQAANGVIIAGWSTALLFALVQKIYVVHHPDDQL